MRFGQGRLLVTWMVTGLTVWACQSSVPRADSSAPAARADSGAPGEAPSLTRADSVVLRTDKAQYHAGDAMTLTLENKGGAHYTFNPCSRSLEHEEGGAWKAVDEPGRVCTMEAWLLDAHATRSGPTELPSPLAAGRYRVVVRLVMERSDGSGVPVSAVSDPITVS